MTPRAFHLKLTRALVVAGIALRALVSTSTSSAVTAAPVAAPPAGTNLAPVKSYLLQHTVLLTKFTRDFRSSSNRYYASAKAVGFDYDELAKTKRASVARELAQAKSLWIRGNPYYEQVEGVVAGTPSLAVYDVILDAGSSAKEDPASAVPIRPEAS